MSWGERVSTGKWKRVSIRMCSIMANLRVQQILEKPSYSVSLTAQWYMSFSHVQSFRAGASRRQARMTGGQSMMVGARELMAGKKEFQTWITANGKNSSVEFAECGLTVAGRCSQRLNSIRGRKHPLNAVILQVDPALQTPSSEIQSFDWSLVTLFGSKSHWEDAC